MFKLKKKPETFAGRLLSKQELKSVSGAGICVVTDSFCPNSGGGASACDKIRSKGCPKNLSASLG